MLRTVFLLLLLLALPSSANTISSAVCPGTGCITSLVADTPASAIQLTGTWSGEIAVELSNDNVTFFPARGYPAGGGTYAASFTTSGGWTVPTGGFSYLRLRATSWSSGTARVFSRPTTSPVPTDVVRAVGSTFGNVAVEGTFDLGSSSLSALSAPTCTLATAPPVLTLTTTPQTVPTTPLTNRTQLVVINTSSTQRVWCCVGAACTPTSTSAYVLLPNGGSRTFPLRDTVPVRCRAALATAEVGAEEASCG